jgi:hypothetical protein
MDNNHDATQVSRTTLIVALRANGRKAHRCSVRVGVCWQWVIRQTSRGARTPITMDCPVKEF